MKKGLICLLCLQCMLLLGCRTALDASKAVAERYETPLHAVVKISTMAGIACDYQLDCVVDTDSSVLEILQPESLAGLKAIIESDACKIQYEDLSLDSLMLPIQGMTPVDCFDQTIYSLKQEVPAKYGYEKRGDVECLSLTYEREEDAYTVTRVFWLKEDSLELLEGEYYLDDVLVMRMTVEECTFTEEGSAE